VTVRGEYWTEAARLAHAQMGQLEAALGVVRTYAPFSSADLDRLAQSDPFAEDAFLKRFEDLAEITTRSLLRAGLEGLGHNPTKLTTVVLLEQSVSTGLIDEALPVAELVRLRNRIVHDYPLVVRGRGELLLMAVQSAPTLLALTNDILNRGQALGLNEGSRHER
jgi:hypothetical protein